MFVNVSLKVLYQRGTAPQNKIVHCLNSISTALKSDNHPKTKLSEKLTTGIKSFLAQVFELLIKTIFYTFWSSSYFHVLIKNHLAYWNFNDILEFSDNLHIIFQKKSADNFHITHKTSLILVWGAVPP